MTDCKRGNDVTLPPNAKRPDGGPKRKRIRRRVQREGTPVLQETWGNSALNMEASNGGLIEMDENWAIRTIGTRI